MTRIKNEPRMNTDDTDQKRATDEHG